MHLGIAGFRGLRTNPRVRAHWCSEGAFQLDWKIFECVRTHPHLFTLSEDCPQKSVHVNLAYKSMCSQLSLFTLSMEDSQMACWSSDGREEIQIRSNSFSPVHTLTQNNCPQKIIKFSLFPFFLFLFLSVKSLFLPPYPSSHLDVNIKRYFIKHCKLCFLLCKLYFLLCFP